MKLSIILIIILVFNINIGVAESRIYYVDQNNANTADTNDGSQNRPWKTIKRSFKQVLPGDTVLVCDGIYRESLELVKSGIDNNNLITFKAVGTKSIIRGSDIVTGWIHEKGSIWKITNWQVDSQQVFVDGAILDQIGGISDFVPVTAIPAVTKGLADLRPGSFYYDRKGKTLYVWLKDSSNPSEHSMEVSVRPFLFYIKNCSYVKISGFNFQHSNTTATFKSGWPAVNVSGRNCFIENNRAEWCDFVGIGGSGTNHVFRNNICNFNGNEGMYFINADNIRIENNTTNFNNYRGFDRDWQAGGIKLSWTKNSIISHHTALNNSGSGIWFDVDCFNNIVENSTIGNNTDNGIFYEISQGGIIRNNIVNNSGKRGIYISASRDCNVMNNLVYSNFRGIVAHGVPRVFRGKAYSLVNNILINNIIMNSTNASLVLAQPSKYVSGNYSDHNLFYQDSGKIAIILGENQLFSRIEDWRKTSGNDGNSIESDPAFKNIASNDFHLLPTSPARGKGKPTPSVNEDFEGKKRSTVINDIGPYKF